METVATKSSLDLAALMRTHQAGVWRFLRAMGAEPSLADDLTQETFLSLINANFEERSPQETAGYLRTTARNHFLKSLSKNGRSIAVAEIEKLQQRYERMGGEDDGEGLIDALKLCLEGLDEKPREALKLQYETGLNRKDAAAKLDLTDDGLKTLLRRTKARLRKCIERRIQS